MKFPIYFPPWNHRRFLPGHILPQGEIMLDIYQPFQHGLRWSQPSSTHGYVTPPFLEVPIPLICLAAIFQAEISGNIQNMVKNTVLYERSSINWILEFPLNDTNKIWPFWSPVVSIASARKWSTSRCGRSSAFGAATPTAQSVCATSCGSMSDAQRVTCGWPVGLGWIPWKNGWHGLSW